MNLGTFLVARGGLAGQLRNSDRRRMAARLAEMWPVIAPRTMAQVKNGPRPRSALASVMLRRLDQGLGIDRAHASDESMTIMAPLLALAGTMAAVYFAASLLLALSNFVALAVALPAGVVAARSTVLQRRDGIHRRMEEQFALALGVIIRCVRAGLPVGEGMRAVAGEVGAPTAAEFQRTVDQIQLGDSFESALAGLARRCVLPDYRFYAVTVVLQRQTGGNLAETLENLHDTIRKRRGVRLKAQALTSETRTTVFVLAILPVGVAAIMMFVSPSYILQLVFTESGRFLLGIAMVIQAFGLFVIRVISRSALS